jgi:hypothetical protein
MSSAITFKDVEKRYILERGALKSSPFLATIDPSRHFAQRIPGAVA